MMALLEVEGLTATLELPGVRRFPVVDGVSFSVEAGETVALVGESGCGKSTTALSLLRIHPEPPMRITAGQVRLAGRDLLRLSEREMRRVRGREIGIVFQEPMTSLNPLMTVGAQIAEAVREHRGGSRGAARAEALALLRLVRMSDAARRLDDYPHRLSGGLRQRAMIAMALAGRPKILIADEPTTALDVTIQAQILALLKQLRHALSMAVVLITHDLGVVAQHADRVVVMYAGRIVETAPTRDLFREPRHPYTQGLLGAAPRFQAASPMRGARLVEIAGTVPGLDRLPDGCAFAPRCPKAVDGCRAARPPLIEVDADRHAACFLAQARTTAI
jgi:peptide/nickel transport system ATP-binding protein